MRSFIQLFSIGLIIAISLANHMAYADFQSGPYYCYENPNQPPNCVIPITNPHHPSNDLYFSPDSPPREGDYSWGYYGYQDYDTQDAGAYPSGGLSGVVR